jgi:hypothetical protein
LGRAPLALNKRLGGCHHVAPAEFESTTVLQFITGNNLRSNFNLTSIRIQSPDEMDAKRIWTHE